MLYEQLWNSPWLWIGVFVIALVITRRRYVIGIIISLFIIWLLGKDWGIVFENIQNLPENLVSNTSSFLGSLYNSDSSRGFFENLFYSDGTWLALFIVLVLATGGQSILLIIGFLLILWLVGSIIISALGIEIFAIVLLASIFIAMFFFMRNSSRNTPQEGQEDRN